jgi:hypothetical protein
MLFLSKYFYNLYSLKKKNTKLYYFKKMINTNVSMNNIITKQYYHVDNNIQTAEN